MAITTKSDMIDVQILMDIVRGEFKGKNAFIGSQFVASGAVRVNGTMPNQGQSAIGKKIDIPYFGTIGEFVQNSDGSSITPSKIGQTYEQATVDRFSLAAEVSRWATGVGSMIPGDGSPYDEAKRQLMVAGERAMDKIMVTEFATTPLIVDVYSAGTPVYMTWDLVQDGSAMWGDDDAPASMVMHSQARKDVAKLKDSTGRPLLLTDQREGAQSIYKFGGLPMVASDRCPLTGSTMASPMGTAGTTPPAITLSGTPLGAYKLRIDMVLGGAAGTARFRFSVDGGNTWSATYLTPAGGGAVVLDDSETAALADINGAKTVDSLVGANGKTGITATFTNATYNVDNVYKSIANLKVTTLLAQQDAGAFWFNADALGIKEDVDILADADIAASHLYHAAKLYRRRRGGQRPGVVAIKHNVGGYIGGTTF